MFPLELPSPAGISATLTSSPFNPLTWNYIKYKSDNAVYLSTIVPRKFLLLLWYCFSSVWHQGIQCSLSKRGHTGVAEVKIPPSPRDQSSLAPWLCVWMTDLFFQMRQLGRAGVGGSYLSNYPSSSVMILMRWVQPSSVFMVFFVCLLVTNGTIWIK